MAIKKNPNKLLAIELTNHCNLKCPQCPQGKLAVPKGYMDRQTFLECLRFSSGYTELNWRGEPLLHPNLAEYVTIAKKVNPTLDLGFHTNGTLLDQALFYSLAKNGLNWLHLSLHTSESCKKYPQIISWNRKLANPLRIHAEVDNTQEELMALSFGFPSNKFQKNQIANWGGFLTDYRAIHGDPGDYAQTCLMIQDNSFIVAYDGRVNACCWDFEQHHSLGQVNHFSAIQHNPPYKRCVSCLWIWYVPRLVEANYKGYNLVVYNQSKEKYHAIAQRLGPLDIGFLSEERIMEYRMKQDWFVGDSLEEIRSAIDQLFPHKQPLTMGISRRAH